MGEMIRMTILIDSELRDELERIAREDDRVLSSAARIAVREYVERVRRKTDGPTANE